MDLYNRFRSPGGNGLILIGKSIPASSSISPDCLVHHITGMGVISTINIPYLGFNGPLYLISDSGFSFNDVGNIVKTSELFQPGRVVTLLYDEMLAKWFPTNNGYKLPALNITAPSTGPLGGLSVTITANATAYNGATLVQAEFYWQDTFGGIYTRPFNLIGLVNGGSPYSKLWTFPICGAFLDDASSDPPHVRLYARALDSNGQYSSDAGVDLRLTGRGC